MHVLKILGAHRLKITELDYITFMKAMTVSDLPPNVSWYISDTNLLNEYI